MSDRDEIKKIKFGNLLLPCEKDYFHVEVNFPEQSIWFNPGIFPDFFNPLPRYQQEETMIHYTYFHWDLYEILKLKTKLDKCSYYEQSKIKTFKLITKDRIIEHSKTYLRGWSFEDYWLPLRAEISIDFSSHGTGVCLEGIEK